MCDIVTKHRSRGKRRTIIIISEGAHDVNLKKITPNQVKDLLTNRIDKEVFLRADSRARYEKVVEVVNNLRASGVDQLGLLTEQIQETTKQKPGSPAPAGAGQ